MRRIAMPFAGRILDHNGHAGLSRAINIPAYLWLAWSFWGCVAGGCLDLWNGVFRRWRLPPRAHLAVVTVLVALATFLGTLEASRPCIRRLDFTAKTFATGSTPLRILHLSDIHLGTIRTSAWNRTLIRRVSELRPDLILMTGDFIDSSARNIGPLARAWADVQPPFGKYAVLGNHEFYAGLADALRLHDTAGFRLLRGSGVDIGDTLHLHGVDDVAGVFQGLPAETSERGLLTVPPGRFTLLLKHQPRIDPLSVDRFDLQLSGHTHGGQIFPFRPIVALFYPLTYGLFEISPRSRLSVSRGAGTWGPPLRLFAPPEITLITLHPPAPPGLSRAD